MIKYTFASLSRFESLGFRLGGSGLGNILFAWARSVVYAKNHNLIRLQTTWQTLKIGTFVRKERDKRTYFDLFTGVEGVTGIRKFLLLNFSNKVKVFSGMEGLFKEFKDEHFFLRNELIKIINPYHFKNAESLNTHRYIAVHIRMGDFLKSNNESVLRNGAWNYRIPKRWYISIIEKIRQITNLPIYVFSDAEQDDLVYVKSFHNCERVYLGSSISDMLAISNAQLLVASSSTFSMWASFLGQIPTIWFPGQLRQKIINDNTIFEGELDYDDNLPLSLQNVLADD